MNPVGRRPAAKIYPAGVCGINVAGADVFADDGAVVGVAAPVHPADVRAVGEFIYDVDGGGGGTHSQRDGQQHGDCPNGFHGMDMEAGPVEKFAHG